MLQGEEAFVPDDPYFVPSSGQSEQPAAGYFGEWHLVNQMPLSESNSGLDVNIAGAWARGLTGAGVVIQIIDDGVQAMHPDLTTKFRNEYSYSLQLTAEQNGAEGFVRGQPVAAGLNSVGDNHGTSVAGVAAAAGGNGIGVTGAAPFADIASVRYLGEGDAPGHTEDEAQAAAILFQGQTNAQGNPDPYSHYVPTPGEPVPVRVKNHSYGLDNGYEASESVVGTALSEAADWGVINVVSAGNERTEAGNSPDAWPAADANKSDMKNSPHVITVAALGSDGRYAYYSSFGANVFVTAPSSGDGAQFEIATTDRLTSTDGYNGVDPYFKAANLGVEAFDYTSTFSGTSSSAPLVAGIMALGVEANPDMNVRMAQHLLATTSRMVDPGDTVGPDSTGGWVTNSAGYNFNNNYGFGLIDADAFTLAATQVASLTEQTTFSTGDLGVGESFTTGHETISRNAAVSFADPVPLEYVQVHFLITGLQTDWATYFGTNGADGVGAIAGDFEAWLVSPSGTRNRLFIDDRAIPADKWEERRDWENFPDLDWTFLSYAYWGEDLNGDWNVELTNRSANLADLGTWDSFSMTFGMGELMMVPEPEGMTLTVLGVIAVFLVRRRRRQ